MNPADLVRALWERMEARDWDGARATLADDYVCDLPDTGERLGHADAFIAANRAYPEGWAITVDEVLDVDGRVVARVRVTHEGVLWHCLSFADVDVAAGTILRSTDFWLEDRGEVAPDWRAQFSLPQEEQ